MSLAFITNNHADHRAFVTVELRFARQNTGGWGGIRTPDTFRYTRFPGVRNRPLCHPSISGRLLITENGGDDNRGVCFFRGLEDGAPAPESGFQHGLSLQCFVQHDEVIGASDFAGAEFFEVRGHPLRVEQEESTVAHQFDQTADRDL